MWDQQPSSLDPWSCGTIYLYILSLVFIYPYKFIYLYNFIKFIIRFSAAVSGEERCVTTLKTAV